MSTPIINTSLGSFAGNTKRGLLITTWDRTHWPQWRISDFVAVLLVRGHWLWIWCGQSSRNWEARVNCPLNHMAVVYLCCCDRKSHSVEALGNFQSTEDLFQCSAMTAKTLLERFHSIVTRCTSFFGGKKNNLTLGLSVLGSIGSILENMVA